MIWFLILVAGMVGFAWTQWSSSNPDASTDERYGLIFSDDSLPNFPVRHAKYEATAMHDYDIGKLLISVSYSSHRTIIPDIEDPLERLLGQIVECYTPDLLAGIPLVLAILNCKSTDKHH